MTPIVMGALRVIEAIQAIDVDRPVRGLKR
jgi:hypothetical protein